MADHNDPDRAGPLPSSPESAGYFVPLCTMQLKLINCLETNAAMLQSFEALSEAVEQIRLLEPVEDCAGLCNRFGLPLTNESDLVRIEIPLRAADRASDDHIFRILPSQRYIELVAAIAGYCRGETVVSHGWPILSVVSRISTVAEGAVPANAAPEGSQ